MSVDQEDLKDLILQMEDHWVICDCNTASDLLNRAIIMFKRLELEKREYRLNAAAVVWVPVTERLPEGGDEWFLLSFAQDGPLVYHPMNGFWNAKRKCFEDCYQRQFPPRPVVAWAPLPAPYTAQGTTAAEGGSENVKKDY